MIRRALVLALLALALTAGQAVASFPGANGAIAFERGKNLWSINPDGTNLRQLTTSGDASSPAWSPDGTALAFTRGTVSTNFFGDGTSDIAVARGDGSSARTLFRTSFADTYASWSPDNRRVVFSRLSLTDCDGPADLVTFDTVSNVQRTIYTGSGYTPDWSPAADTIAFERRFSCFEPGDLMQVGGSGGGASAFPFAPDLMTPEAGADLQPSWSPDGTRFAETSVRWDCTDLPGGGSSCTSHTYVATRKSDGSAWRVLAEGEDPSWSPDGGSIAYIAGGELRIFDLAAGTDRQVTTRGAAAPSWQPLPVRPVPVLTALEPAERPRASAAFTLLVHGDRFTRGSDVLWNGVKRTTTFVSPTRLNAAIPASDLATAGLAQVVVRTPAPGGGDSGAISFRVVGPQAGGPPPTNLVPPAIAGSTVAGSRLVCSTGTWSNTPTAFEISWLRNATPVAGATGPSFDTSAGDAGALLSCRVSATNAGGTSTAVSSALTIAAAAVPAAGAPILVPAPVTAPVGQPAARGRQKLSVRFPAGGVTGRAFIVRLRFAVKPTRLLVRIEERRGGVWTKVASRRVSARDAALRVVLTGTGLHRLRVRYTADGALRTLAGSVSLRAARRVR